MREKGTRRFLLVLAGVVLFSGLLVFSVLKVRFPVAAGEKSEFAVIEYSLTDSVKRGEDGRFVLSAALPGDAAGTGTTAKPCPT
jgi:hypothetical protein